MPTGFDEKTACQKRSLQNFIFRFERIAYEPLWGKSSVPVIVGPNGLRSDHSRAGEGTLSFDTLANAFPATYFSRYSVVRDVSLTAHISAKEARLSIVRVDDQGRYERISCEKMTDYQGVWESSPISLSEKTNGRLFLEVRFSGPFSMESVSWTGSVPSFRHFPVLMSITAFKRDDFVKALVKDILSYGPLNDFPLSILIVDNGQTLSRDQFPDDSRLRLVPQKNLGCTSGFMKGLIEAESSGQEYMVIADDDIVMPPESLFRMLTFQHLATKPLVIGSAMIVIRKPNILWEQGGRVLRKGLCSLETLNKGLDIESTSQLSMAYEVNTIDYTALWLMCAPVGSLSFLPSFYIYYEDILQCLLLKKKGLEIVVPPHIYLWHATLEKQGALWKRYLWVRNDLVTRLIIPETLSTLRTALSFLQTIARILAAFDYQLAENYLQAFREVIMGVEWSLDPVNEGSFVQELIQKNPKIDDLSDRLSPLFLEGAKRPGLGRKILRRAIYMGTLGNYLNPFARSSDREGKLAFRHHSDFEGWGWVNYKTLAAVDREGRGYVCHRSLEKAIAILIRALPLVTYFLWNASRLKEAYRESLGSYEKAWKKALSESS